MNSESSIKSDFLHNPEDYVIIKDMQQLLDAYPEVFTSVKIARSEEMQIPELNCSVEVLKDNFQKRFARFFLYDSFVLSLNSQDNTRIWSMDPNTEEGKLFLLKLEAEFRDYKDKKVLVTDFKTDEGNFSVRMFPYGENESAKIILDELDFKSVKIPE